MVCVNQDPWHLEISKEACDSSGGKWHQSPCVFLKQCTDDRPSRFQPDAPNTKNCQDTSTQLITNYVSGSMLDADFPFDKILTRGQACLKILPEFAGVSSSEWHGCFDLYCTCHYKDKALPSKDLLPTYTICSLSKFSLKDPTGKFVLGLSPQGDCKFSDISVQGQTMVDGNHRQQFQITRGGRIVSPSCPGN